MKLKPLTEQQLDEMLSQPLVAKIATTDAGGEIRMTPIWFARSDGDIMMNTFKNSDLVRNLRVNNRCSLMVDSRDWPYYGVHYWGTATVEGPEDDAEGIAKMFQPYVGTMDEARAYAKGLISAGRRVYVRFTPSRSVTWDFRE